VAASDNTTSILSTCFCIPKFFYSGRRCEIDCTSTLITNSTGIKVEYDACACQAQYSWDVNVKNCIVDCAKIANANTSATTEANLTGSCVCDRAYSWNSTSVSCVWDCSTVPRFAVATTPTVGSCNCIQYYVFSTTTNECLPNCSELPHSLGEASVGVCNCNTSFSWNDTSK